MTMRHQSVPIPAEPMFTNDEWFARLHLFDDGIRQMEHFLESLPDDDRRREFWLFVSFFCRTVVDNSKDPNFYPKKDALMQKLAGNEALKIYQPFFDWYLVEIEKPGADFDEVFTCYWSEIHQPVVTL